MATKAQFNANIRNQSQRLGRWVPARNSPCQFSTARIALSWRRRSWRSGKPGSDQQIGRCQFRTEAPRGGVSVGSLQATRGGAYHLYRRSSGDWTPTARWHSGRSSDTTRASRGHLESRIAKKNGRVRAYRVSAPSVWLLIVSDLFLGPGEVYARPDDLAKWKFTFDFDKVLLFSRQPGGGGDATEIQRA